MTTRDTRAPPSLLFLPRELGDEVLKAILFSNTGVRITAPNRIGFGAGPPGLVMAKVDTSSTLHPKVLRTCKQLHREGIEIMYGTNQFRILDAVDFSSIAPYASVWLKFISSPALAHITSITLQLSTVIVVGNFGIELQRRIAAWSADTETKSVIETFTTLSTHPQDLRHLGIIFDSDPPWGCNYLIHIVSTIKAISAIHGLKSFEIAGDVPASWLPKYFNRNMKVAVDCVKVQSAILDLKKAIEYLHNVLQDTCHYIAVNYPEAVLPGQVELPDFTWIEDEELCTTAFDDPTAYATAEQRARYDRSTVDLLAAGVGLLVAENDLHSGNLWPPVNFYMEEARIETANVLF
jgi:hypothetical protein